MYIHFWCNALPKKTLKIVRDTGNDAILQVKDNQKTLNRRCEQIAKQTDLIDTFSDTYKWHWREEFRKSEIYIASDLRASLDSEWLEYIEMIIKVTRTTKIFDTRSKTHNNRSEISYYVSTFSSTAKVFHHWIRSHWWIENRNHYVILDLH